MYDFVRWYGHRCSGENIILKINDDFYGDIIFYQTVNAPDDALFAINVQDGTTSVLETDGTTTPIQPVTVSYKARFTDDWLQWIRRITSSARPDHATDASAFCPC